MRTLLLYSKEWRGEDIQRLYKAFTVLLQRQRAYALEKIVAKAPNRALVFTYPCGWHGDVLFIAPYIVAVGPFERDAFIDMVLTMPDRVAFTILEGGWTLEEVFKEFGPFDVGIACEGSPVSGARRYVHKMIVIKVGGPMGELINTLYRPEDTEADEVIEAPV